MLTAIFSVATFIYITIIIAIQSGQRKTRSQILRIPWLYWTEFVLTIMTGVHLIFRLYTARSRYGLIPTYAKLTRALFVFCVAFLFFFPSIFQASRAANGIVSIRNAKKSFQATLLTHIVSSFG